MKRPLILGAIALTATLGAGTALTYAADEPPEPFKAVPVVIPDKPTDEERQKAADNDPARLYGERTGLMPALGYVNAEGEAIAYVRLADLRNREDGQAVDVVTLKGTKVGEWDPVTGSRPSPEAVEAAVEGDG